ncbi:MULTISPECIES: LamG-like jellyroll fold domain-containing protein [unclassified Microbacterium]|uniref:LamG-like jellyroll fold domain-containing protein n=1 Tax=unclassified Microbacterium TaxID=2609290 RepID=UPI0012F9F8C1|nr:LamG-like jellyroll fold domain-containing protein [Microbacterium sp. MAH-37]MVQ41216.1 family 43 glycosylhydrolase [Microbacterium sp. MAH-37]
MPRRTTRAVLALTAAAAVASALLTAPPAFGGAEQTPPPPRFHDVSVHDPSIVTSGDDIWVFGSHGASARTTDLMNWEQFTVDLSQNTDNALFDDVRTELADAFAWAQTSTLWAADVIRLPDGRYAMYYNACEGSKPLSAMGLATSDSVDGPYENQGILLKSGMTGESENPGEVYDARKHPNAVDPDAFYDADGRLWMVYGSYSGGIFLLEMDAATGEPLPGQGYGTHLVGGNHSRIEGPTIEYDAQTGYYYLYLSFGGLDASGGYDVRVARSKDVAGPYLDAQGNDMREVKADPSLPIFDDASVQPYGVKLMGGHLFGRELGDPGTGPGTGYVSPGHTSWYVDDAGRRFMVFHSRFPGTGEMHQVRVHQMWMNADGWPVVSPMRYAGETAGKVKRADVVGSWQFVNLGKDITAVPARATKIDLGRSGDVTGSATGTWKLTGQHTATLTLDGEAYDGVFAPIWDPDLKAWSIGFTASSDAGVTVWGRRSVELHGQAAVDAVLADIAIGTTATVDLELPVSGTGGTTIAWSSNGTAITADGTVTRPAVGEPDARITLTATATDGTATGQRAFEIFVPARTAGALADSWAFDGALTAGSGVQASGVPTGARVDAPGGTVSYVADGVSGSALHLDGGSGVRLPDGLIQGRSYSVSVWLRPEQLTAYTSAFFAARDADHWVSLVPRGHSGVGGSAMVWAGTAWYDAGTGADLPLNAWSHLAYVVDDGAITVYVDGERRFQGTGFPDVLTTDSGVFAIGVNWWDAPFRGDVDELTVWKSALSPQDIADLAASPTR